MSENESLIEYFCTKYPKVVIKKSINPSWFPLLNLVFVKNVEKLGELHRFLETISEPINPVSENIWAFTKFGNPNEIKVVIVGQDPYLTPELGDSIGFSVNSSISDIPPSLQNILDEVWEDVSNSMYAPSLKGFPPQHGCLENWAKQGVLLLDSVLTVTHNAPQSHRNRGWEEIVGSMLTEIQNIAKNSEEFVIFMLWGRVAWQMESYVDTSGDNKVLKAGHPSPNNELADYRGCRHFTAANYILEQAGKQPVDWSL
ncbi:uracil-DNA glycosylase [Leptinotarsa decemlineata]|uniref:uracil-DNA glycosylase n=1 Tax=Leptinotarsa decemlineata TaxID=7539 RepID=UPI003D30814E